MIGVRGRSWRALSIALVGQILSKKLLPRNLSLKRRRWIILAQEGRHLGYIEVHTNCLLFIWGLLVEIIEKCRTFLVSENCELHAREEKWNLVLPSYSATFSSKEILFPCYTQYWARITLCSHVCQAVPVCLLYSSCTAIGAIQLKIITL